MTRHFWVLLHRYAGLYMAFFLTVAGLTGCVLAFFHELDGWLNADLHHVAIQDKPLLDVFSLREKALALVPQVDINLVSLEQKPGQAYEAELIPRTDPVTGQPFSLPHQVIYLNPYNGEVMGYGDAGYWPLTRRNILPFIYLLHYSLALGQVGVWLFGSAALIWTVDCFVAFYLTLPLRRKAPACYSPSSQPSPSREKEQVYGDRKDSGTNRNFWARWAIAWKIKWPASAFRLNFDLHRAGGLWTWLMLLVFAWSSVAFNLPAVYQPVMAIFFDMPDLTNYPTANLPEPKSTPKLDWHTAYQQGRELMQQQQQTYSFKVLGEQALMYQAEKGLYAYLVKSDLDIADSGGSTGIWFDGDSGELVQVLLPIGQQSGFTVTLWLATLHMAHIWGLPYKIFVCLMGLMVAMLSVTGGYIWWKKRRARYSSRTRREPLVEQVDD